MMPDTSEATNGVIPAEPAPVGAGGANNNTQAQTGRPWSALVGVCLAWLLPATTARRTERVSLRAAFGTHLAAAVVTFIVFLCLIAIESEQTLPDVTAEVINEFFIDPVEASLIVLIIASSIETGLILLALLVMPWGAKDERLRTSYESALRQTWLHAGHALPVVLLVGLIGITISHAQSAYQESRHRSPQYPIEPMPPYPQPGLSPDSPGWAEYQQARWAYAQAKGQYEEAVKVWHAERRRAKPLPVRFASAIMVWSVLSAGTWILWSLIRGAATPRSAPPTARPPTCEICGYNLTRAPMEGRCSECGAPVIESLGPEVRPDSLWQRRREIGWVRAYWGNIREAVLDARGFGRKIRISSSSTDHRWFFAGHVALAFLIGVAGAAAALTILFQPGYVYEPPEEIWSAMAPITSGIGVLIMLGVVGLCAVIVAVNYRIRVGRNLAGVAMRVACYQSVCLIPWAVLAGLNAIGVYALARSGFFQDIERRAMLDDDFLVFLAFTMPNLVVAILYLALIWRGTSGARFANR